MSKKKNKKVSDDGSEKKDGGNAAEVAKEQQKEEEPSGKSNKKSEDGPKKENNGGGGGGGGNAVLLKTDLHCEGCANKIVKFTRGFPGVETVKVDGSSGKITVNGKVDPADLREKLEQKTHKKVELLSPVPKKEKENAKGKDGTGDGKGDKKKEAKDDNKKKGKDEKAPKEPQVTTAVLKVPLHCEGCIHKIQRIVSKTKGYEEIKFDKQKDLVTVKGAMDMKALAENLKKHLKRAVDIVPPKKDEKKDEKKEKGGGGGGGEAKAAALMAAAGAANGGGGGDGVEKMEGNKMQQMQQFGQQQFGYGIMAQPPPAYDYPTAGLYYGGGPAYVTDPYQFHHHAPQMFSDENPNACSIM